MTRPFKLEDGVKKYQCTKCKQWKPWGGFHQLPHQLLHYSRCGIRSYCKECTNLERRKYKRNRNGGKPLNLSPERVDNPG